MKDKNKINLENIQTKNMSYHAVKRYKKPKEIVREVKRKKPEQNPFLQKTITKSLISLAVCLCVLAISSIDNEIFNEATRGIDYLVNHEMDLEETFSFLSEMEAVVPAVSDSNLYFTAPTNGKVISDLQDEADTTVGKLYSAPDGYCYSACDGVVFYVDKISIDCPYIRIRHEDGFDTIYMGLASTVEVGDTVKRQQIVGECIGDNIGFILMQNSKYIDSDKYIDTAE